MSNHYFDNFENIRYNGYPVKNILSRAKILQNVSNNSLAFYDYNLNEKERPDKIADKYYDDMFYSWLLYLANDIIDPYYGWFLSDESFKDFIAQKYSSDIQANRKILYFRVNWDEDDSSIPISVYNSMTQNQQKYWTPEFLNGKITSYERSKLDWNTSTNLYLNIGYSDSTAIFSSGDMISFTLANTIISTSEVYSVDANNSIVTLRHVIGSTRPYVMYKIAINGSLTAGENVTVANSTVSTTMTYLSSTISSITLAYQDNIIPRGEVFITGANSNNNVKTTGAAPTLSTINADFTGNSSIIQTSNVLSQNIPLEEQIYWGPHTAYEFEDEKNTQKKTIRILDKGLSLQASLDLKNLMGG